MTQVGVFSKSCRATLACRSRSSDAGSACQPPLLWNACDGWNTLNVIRGYRTEIDPSMIGAPITAFIRVAVTGEVLARFINITKKLPEVLECHRVTGAESFLIKVAVASIEHMEATIDKLSPYVATTTSVVLSSPVTWRAFEPIKEERKRSRLRRTR